MNLLRIAWSPGAAVAALLLTACGSSSDSASEVPLSPPAATSTESADRAATNESALASVFAGVTTIDEATYDVSTLSNIDSVIWFWAPWCTICRAEAPNINEIAARYGDRINMVGVAGRGELDQMADFVDDTDTGALTHVADVDGTIWNAFEIYAQPAFAFVDDTGEITTFTGALGVDDLAAQIESMLAT